MGLTGHNLIRYVFMILFSFAILDCSAQNTRTVKPKSFRKGVKITYSGHLECYPDVTCSKADSNIIDVNPPVEWTVFIRGPKMRIEYPGSSWDFDIDNIDIYPEKGDLHSVYCASTKYFNYFIEWDPDMQFTRIGSDGYLESYEELPGITTISGFRCKSGIVHNGSLDWLVYYTDDLPEIPSPHQSELYDNFSFIHDGWVPHFIVQLSEARDTSIRENHLVYVQTVKSVEFQKLHDSLFRLPPNYIKLRTWDDARDEYMKRWEADLAGQLAVNPLTTEEREAFYGHWIYEDEYGTYYLHIQPNHSPERYGDTCFVRDFMFRKRERSSGTLGNWNTRMMGRILFHEFGRSWSYDKDRDVLVDNANPNFSYRRATAEEEKSSMRECDLIWAAWDMADSLEKWGYSKVLVENEGWLADSLWNMPDGEEILKRVAYRYGSNREQRFIAAEIIFRKDPAYPPLDDKQLLADLSHAYANALSYDYAPFGEYWGSVENGTIGICGRHLLRIGKAAIPELMWPLNQQFDFYMEYQSGAIDIANGPRKKDHAAFFLSLLIDEPYTFKPEKTEREADIELLREKLKSYR